MSTRFLDHVWLDRPRLIKESDEAVSQKLGVSLLTARVLKSRPLESLDQAHDYWQPGLESLHDPFELKDMDKAVERLVIAIKGGEKIVIWGDYDVDGSTSVALLMRFFKFVGAQVSFHIPHRLHDGYGLNQKGLTAIRDEGGAVVITVDNGITAMAEALHAKSLGLDLIITDHHETGETLPDAYAVINPKRPDCNYPDQNLAGVGLAFKLACGVAKGLSRLSMSEDMKEFLLESLSLVAVGTIADLVPLIGENRILAGIGLYQLGISRWPGLNALLEISRIEAPVYAHDIGFKLGPRINAAGRLDSADTGVKLMITDDTGLARRLAQELDANNTSRRQIEKEHSQLAVDMIEKLDNDSDERVLVVSGDNWHPGVIGIVASRLVDRHHLPCIVIAFDGEVGKASCRSIEGFNMQKALVDCQDHLLEFGGHAMAAGFSIHRDSLEAFTRKMQELAKVKFTNPPKPVLHIDAWVDLKSLNTGVINEFRRLAPFGMQNPKPLLATRSVRITGLKRMGRDGSHLSFNAVTDGKVIRSIAYRAGHLYDSLDKSEACDIAYEPQWNDWGGRGRMELILKGLRLGATG